MAGAKAIARRIRSAAERVVARQFGSLSCLVGLMLLSQMGCQFQLARHTADGQQYLRSGQFSQAVDSFQQALMSNPQNADANYNLGTTYYYLAKQTSQPHLNPKSEDLLRQAIALNPSHADAYRTLAALYVETNRPNDAFQLIRGWQVTQPESPEPLVEMARLYREHNDPTRATQYLADALTLAPNHSRALVAMGTLREEQGQYDLALKNYTRSIQANSYQPQVAERIASIQQRFQTDVNPQSGTRYANPNLNSFLR
ncbi:MAG: tetratricopeptide repeat protein [Planctomycetaceae bacterium]|nr:tetratricopeptide repeat protein [Planctomycetaceae bacterium]